MWFDNLVFILGHDEFCLMWIFILPMVMARISDSYSTNECGWESEKMCVNYDDSSLIYLF